MQARASKYENEEEARFKVKAREPTDAEEGPLKNGALPRAGSLFFGFKLRRAKPKMKICISPRESCEPEGEEGDEGQVHKEKALKCNK